MSFSHKCGRGEFEDAILKLAPGSAVTCEKASRAAVLQVEGRQAAVKRPSRSERDKNMLPLCLVCLQFGRETCSSHFVASSFCPDLQRDSPRALTL